MSIVSNFISEYGTDILYGALVAIAGFLGTAIKKIFEKYINDKTKKDVVKTCVKAVEQLYKDLHGAEKFEKAFEASVEMLNSKGINITELEVKMLIESAVAEFNNAFNKGTTANKDVDTSTEIETETQEFYTQVEPEKEFFDAEIIDETSMVLEATDSID